MILILEFGPNYFDNQKCAIGEKNASDANIDGDELPTYEKFHVSDDKCVSAVFRLITLVFSSISILVVLIEEKKYNFKHYQMLFFKSRYLQ